MIKKFSWLLISADFFWLLALAALSLAMWAAPAFAESQSDEYKGVTDPFGDPTNYEFQEDERDDKEFFHLGRYVMFGLDLGAGIFTGGLGATNAPGFYFGGHLVYFFDHQIAMEIAAHYANDVDTISPPTAPNLFAQINTDLIPITFAFRYYFDTKNAPKAIAMANPYLIGGGGIYLRNQTDLQSLGNFKLPSGGTTSFGAFGGAGTEFAIYGRHVYLGVDMRYHFIFWPDANDTFGSTALTVGARGGGYVTAASTLTYSF